MSERVSVEMLREIVRTRSMRVGTEPFDIADELLELKTLPEGIESAERFLARHYRTLAPRDALKIVIEDRDAAINAAHAKALAALTAERDYWKQRAEGAEELACDLGDAKQHVDEAKTCSAERDALTAERDAAIEEGKRLRMALEAAKGVMWMAEQYAEAGGRKRIRGVLNEIDKAYRGFAPTKKPEPKP